MNIINQESKNDYSIRIIGGLIGLSLCLNFVQLEYGLLINIFGILVAFVFWGIGVNLMAYILSNLLTLLLTRISKEKIYRAIIIGHIPLVLGFVTANGIELIEARKNFLIGIEVISIFVSVLLLYRLVMQERNIPTTSAKNP